MADDKPDDEDDDEKDETRPGGDSAEHAEGAEGGDAEGDEDPESEDGAMADKILNAIAELGAKVDALAAAGGTAGAREEKDGEPAEFEAAVAKHTAALTADVATLKTQNEALTKEAAALRAERARATALEKARNEVVGFSLTPKDLEEAYDKTGQAGLDLVVGLAKNGKMGVRAPDDSWTRDEGRETGGLPQELAKFANQGAEVATFALQCKREYDAQPASLKRGMTLEKYVETRIRSQQNAVANGTAS